MNLEDQFKFIENLNSEIKNILYKYTGGLYSRINMKLYHGAVLDEDEQKYVDAIDFCFDSVPPLSHDLILYRGIRGDIFNENVRYYVSCTYDVSIAKTFTEGECCLLKIFVSRGNRVLPLENISESKHEQEILLNRNGYFTKVDETKIDDVKTFVVKYEHKNNIESNDNIEEIVNRYINLFDEEEKDFLEMNDENYIKYLSRTHSISLNNEIMKMVKSKI